MRFNKKGQHEVLKEIIGLILVLAVFFLILKVTISLVSSFMPQDKAERSFDELTKEIYEVISSDENPKISKRLIYSHPNSKYDVFAFDYDYEDKVINEPILLDDGFIKPNDNSRKFPDQCQKKACICLYKKTPELVKDPNKNLVKCQIFQGKVYFSSIVRKDLAFIGAKRLYQKDSVAELFSRYNLNYEYKSLWISGNTGFFKTLKSVPTYIEKVTFDDDIHHILIGFRYDKETISFFDEREYNVRLEIEKTNEIYYINQLNLLYNEEKLLDVYDKCQEFKDLFPKTNIPQLCLLVKECSFKLEPWEKEIYEEKRNQDENCICIKKTQDSVFKTLCKKDHFCLSSGLCVPEDYLSNYLKD
jgi:hypothetical protein